MPIYPTLSIGAAALVVALELLVFRTGIFRQAAYWVAMAIVFAFMIPVDGWLTKLSAPIVLYREADTSGLRPVWDILAEEFLYAFALLTLVILVWDRAGRSERAPDGATDDTDADDAGVAADRLPTATRRVEVRR
jgi:lycopene cyclase domain-containing protein